MTRYVIRFGALAGVLALSACDLQVNNPNDPDAAKIFASPQEAEAVLGVYYRRWHAGMYGNLGNQWGIANVQSFENYSSLANNAQNARAGIPRPANDNSIGNVAQGEQQLIYYRNSEVARIASTILTPFINSTPEKPFSLAVPGTNSTAQDLRAKAFAEFLRGVSLGYLAMLYDSAGVPTTNQAPEEYLPLMGYMEVADSAYAALERAKVYAETPPTGGGGFPLPGTWIAGTALDAPGFVRLIRSYRARFRAGVARDPAERAAVNWAAVVADASAGIETDHSNLTNTNTGPFKTWVAQYNSFGQWHQMPPWIIGMGDTSGAYAAWLNLPLASRGVSSPFTLVTPDLRLPQGPDRVAQQADFAVTTCESAATPCERYFRNRPSGDDQPAGLAWGQSNYDWVRNRSWFIRGDGGTGQNGTIVYFTKAENDLLAAEGHYRLGNLAQAAALINITRTRGMSTSTPIVATGGGLPPVTATPDGGLTGNACVPKKPVNAAHGGGGSVVCGDLFEALKWEKRIETAYTHFAAWFFDHRGWGDLAQDTPLHWAPPYQDLMARRLPVYSTGPGTDGGKAAAVSGYGW